MIAGTVTALSLGVLWLALALTGPVSAQEQSRPGGFVLESDLQGCGDTG